MDDDFYNGFQDFRNSWDYLKLMIIKEMLTIIPDLRNTPKISNMSMNLNTHKQIIY